MPLEIKMHGCKNRFVVVAKLEQVLLRNREARQQYATISARKNRLENFIADGYLFVLPGNTGKYDVEMEYFDINREKIEAVWEAMCGNGIRCFSRYTYDNIIKKKKIRVATGDGIKEVWVNGTVVNVNMGIPKDFIKLEDNTYMVNTSLPHMVCIFDEAVLDVHKDLELAKSLGGKIRYDKELGMRSGYPDGFQVNFVNVVGSQTAKIVTYEKGVEDLTLACGTGCTAVGYVLAKARGLKYPITVKNLGGDVQISIKKRNVILTGPAEYY